MTASLAGLVAPDRRSRSRAIRELAPSDRARVRASPRAVHGCRRRRSRRRRAPARRARADLRDLAPRRARRSLAARARHPAARAREDRLGRCHRAGSRAVETERLWWVRRTAVYALAALARRDRARHVQGGARRSVLARPSRGGARARRARCRRSRHPRASDRGAEPSLDAPVLARGVGTGRASRRRAPATPASLLPRRAARSGSRGRHRAARRDAPCPRSRSSSCSAIRTRRCGSSRSSARRERRCRGPSRRTRLARRAARFRTSPRRSSTCSTGSAIRALALAEHALAHRRPARRRRVGDPLGRRDAVRDALRRRASPARTPIRSLRALATSTRGDAELVAWAEPARARRDRDRAPRAPRVSDALLDARRRRRIRRRARCRSTPPPAATSGRASKPALDDPHHGPRAVATRWLVRDRPHRRRRAARRSGSRRARSRAGDPHHAPALVADRDPWVARAAARALMCSSVAHAPSSCRRVARGRAALGAADPWVRATACRLPIVDDDSLARVDRRRSPTTPRWSAQRGARSTRAGPGRAARCARRALGSRTGELVDTGSSAPSRIAAIVHLGQPERPRVAKPPVHVERRPFGRAGFSVAPLAISGAFDLVQPTRSPLAADAGVDLWFWEPAYENLTRFLRTRPRDHVIAGSYHADARSIEADVDRALRKLRRDALDVFLLFWSRSPARVDAAAFATIERPQARRQGPRDRLLDAPPRARAHRDPDEPVGRA